MKRIVAILTITLLITIIFAGCTADKQSDVYPEPTGCDTSRIISYSLDIKPIMTSNCNSCHSGGSPESGVHTDTYEGLSAVAGSGSLWAVVNWTGAIRMPFNGDKLPACELGKIRKWIDEVAPEN
ncbi:MAG TPA: hypothetical protein PKG48_05625 [Bacteroidales bacterium]|nr:hypothetical protein [Bacteroidales bacterium]HPS62103.1 hypothetical protein [Bacteroidales bacterium]